MTCYRAGMFSGSRVLVLVAWLCMLVSGTAAAAPTVQVSARHYLPALDDELPWYGMGATAAASDAGYLVAGRVRTL